MIECRVVMAHKYEDRTSVSAPVIEALPNPVVVVGRADARIERVFKRITDLLCA
jgi:hypothetical protein